MATRKPPADEPKKPARKPAARKPAPRKPAAPAAEKPVLRLVTEQEPPAQPPRRLTVLEAAESDNPRDLLVALRERLSKTIDDPNTAARDLAALTRRVQEINREIAAIDARAAEEVDGGKPTEDESWDSEAI